MNNKPLEILEKEKELKDEILLRRPDIEKIEILLNSEINSDINYKDNNGKSPIIWATRGGHLEIVDLLLSKGADPNDTDTTGVVRASLSLCHGI